MKTYTELLFFQQALGYSSSWSVDNIFLEKDKNEVHIYLSHKANEYLDENTGELMPIYDLRKERTWQHLPILGYSTYLHCRIPRIKNKSGKVVTVPIPWADEQDSFTTKFSDYVVELLQATHKKTITATLACTSFDKVQRIMEKAVGRGIERRTLEGVNKIGIDEKAIEKGHQYASILVDIENGCVLDVVKGRDKENTKELIKNTLSEEEIDKLECVTMDMWQAYMSCVEELAPQADIVHDKFHIVKYLGKAIDDTRKKEVKQAPILKNSKYTMLKNTNNQTIAQAEHFEQIMEANIDTSKVWALTQQFKDTVLDCDGNIVKAYAFFDMWIDKVMGSSLRELKKTAVTFKKHITGIINYVKHKVTNAIVERINGKIQTLNQVARGYTNFNNFRTAVLFYNGKLNLMSHKNQ